MRVGWFAAYTAGLIGLTTLLCSLGMLAHPPAVMVESVENLQRSQITTTLDTVLEGWKYPRVTALGGGATANQQRNLAFITKDPYQAVWDHYARLCGYERPYEPQASASGSTSLGEMQMESEKWPDGVKTSFTFKSGPDVIHIELWKGNSERVTHIRLIGDRVQP